MNQSMNRPNNMSRPGARPAVPPAAPAMQEYSIRMAEKSNKQHHLMKFNYNLNVSFDKWSSVKMERENNLKNFKGFQQEEQPKFGAGSEYNREAKEEARRKKYGINIKKYNANAQPWILEDGNKKFRGTREGGIGDNSSYYVFAHNEDGTITAHKLEEWYSFQPIQRYKPLSAEQAEEEFARRTNCVNKWSMKLKMQLNANNGEEEQEAEEAKSKKGSKLNDKISSLKISDKDEFINSSDESSSDEDNDGDKKSNKDNESKAKQKKAKGKAALANKKKKDRDLDDEAGEESDDGDQEGRECDYIESSDSESEPETETPKNQLKSVEEEKDTFSSDDDSDDEKEDKEKSEEEKKEKLERDNKMANILNDSPAKEDKEGVKKDKEGVKKDKEGVKKVKEYRSKKDIFNDAMNAAPGSGNKSDFSSDSDDEDVKPSKDKKDGKESKSKDKKDSKDKKESKDKKYHSKSQSKALASTEKSSLDSEASNKRKTSSPPSPVAKRIKIDGPAPVATPTPFSIYSNKDSNGLNEEAVRRYLVRKPMTTTELITKFRKLKTVPKDTLVVTMTAILKKINPNRQTIQGKMYLSLKEM